MRVYLIAFSGLLAIQKLDRVSMLVAYIFDALANKPLALSKKF